MYLFQRFFCCRLWKWLLKNKQTALINRLAVYKYFICITLNSCHFDFVINREPSYVFTVIGAPSQWLTDLAFPLFSLCEYSQRLIDHDIYHIFCSVFPLLFYIYNFLGQIFKTQWEFCSLYWNFLGKNINHRILLSKLENYMYIGYLDNKIIDWVAFTLGWT